MTDIFEGSEATFTPVAGDYIRAVDDPTGTPISGNFTITALVTLLNTLISSGGASTPPGRLTLESGVPVSTTDQADKTTLYYTPYVGNQIMLYTGSAWETKTFAELSLNISAFTASKPYDIFVYNNSGTVTLEGLVWTNATTRATALAYQDGWLVKSGATTKLYLGTIYMDSASKCQDTLLKRFVWNYYNRIGKVVKVVDTTDSWTYATSAWRSANNSTANRVEVVTGVAENNISLAAYQETDAGSGANRGVGIGVDATNANNCQITAPTYNNGAACIAIYKAIPTPGYHYYQWVEYSSTGVTITFYGDLGTTVWQLGMIGEVIG